MKTRRLLAGRRALATLAGLALLALTTHQARAVTFGYEVNSTASSSGKQIFSYDPVTMKLTVVADATVDLTVDGATFANAAFDFSATKDGLTTVSSIAGESYSSTAFTGSFSFLQAGSGAVILSASFQDGVLFARDGAFNGALFQSDNGANLVQFTFGPALGSLAGKQKPPEGFSFALGDAHPDLDVDGQNQLNGFTANSSFEAQAGVIPEPGAIVLAAFGLFGGLTLRRRPHTVRT